MNADERWFQGTPARAGRAPVLGVGPLPRGRRELPTLQRWQTPWPEGQRSLQLRLTHDVVTGRRLIEA
jgi:hypothetical protein